MRNSTVRRIEPDNDTGSDAYFLITVDADSSEATTARLRMQFPGADIRPGYGGAGTFRMYRGEYVGRPWHSLTDTDVAMVVQQDNRLLHIVLARDPMYIDAIQMRASRELTTDEQERLGSLGLTVHRIDEPQGYVGCLYRLVGGVGNDWPEQSEIAQALDATSSEPPRPDVW